MQNKFKRLITLSFLATTFAASTARADIEWSGVYRIEAINLTNPELGHKRAGAIGNQSENSLDYALTHLVLRPKIVAGDGLTIYGQFDLFNNRDYPNSQLGALWGSGVRDTGAATEAEKSNTLARAQRAETISISQLYLTLTHEYGSLILGRVPLHFGLGVTHNAGRGLFDHWYETDDLVGYKFVVGNLYFLPMYGKVYEGAINQSDDLNDYMLQVQYENPESDLEMGAFAQNRRGGDQASDAPAAQGAGTTGDVLGGSGATATGRVDIKTFSLYALKDTPHYRLGLEAAFQSGQTGVITTGKDNVTLDAFAVASELEWRPEASRWKWGLKAGIASGDDPATNAKFEGFLFNRNYDVAMLMFNQPLGEDDFLRTRVLTGSVRNAKGNITTPDVETISNVFYFAPSAKYALSDRWSLDNTLVTGWLATNPLEGGKDPGKNLGFEWDVALNFAPRKGVMWVNQLGMLFPGGVWHGDGQYDASMAYGIATKAAISF